MTKRLTLKELRDRIDNMIDQFGDCPIMNDECKLDFIIHENDSYHWLMLIEPNEIADEERRQNLIEHGIKFEEHEYLKR